MFDCFFGANLPGIVFPPNGARAEVLNAQQTIEIYNRFINMALSRFRWTGLPDSCNERALEMTLLFYGVALFANDPDLGYIHTAVTLPGPFNIYYESVVREAYSFEYRHRFDIDNSVLIRANKTMTPDYLSIWNYSPKISNALRSIDIHTETIKRPFAIQCDEKDKQSAITAANKIAGNEIAIFGSKFGNPESVKVMNFGVNCVLNEMWANVRNYMQQLCTSLGIDSLTSDKKERLISAEGQGQRNPTRHIIESELWCRERACEEINAMFGLNVGVELNAVEEFMEEFIEMDKGFQEGGEDDVSDNRDKAD